MNIVEQVDLARERVAGRLRSEVTIGPRRVLHEVRVQRLSGDQRIFVAIRQARLDAIRVENRLPSFVGRTDLGQPVVVLLS